MDRSSDGRIQECAERRPGGPRKTDVARSSRMARDPDHERDHQIDPRRIRAIQDARRGAVRQVHDDELLRPGPNGGNSLANICWHVSGNLRSRFTDFLTSDGEKPWRRCATREFDERTVTRAEFMEKWEAGWSVLFAALADLTDDRPRRHGHHSRAGASWSTKRCTARSRTPRITSARWCTSRRRSAARRRGRVSAFRVDNRRRICRGRPEDDRRRSPPALRLRLLGESASCSRSWTRWRRSSSRRRSRAATVPSGTRWCNAQRRVGQLAASRRAGRS